MSSGERYFTTPGRYPIRVNWEIEDEWMACGNTHVLLDETDPENSPPLPGYAEVTEGNYNAALLQAQGMTQDDEDASVAIAVQAAEDAYNDLVANGVSAATATVLTGHTP